MKLFLWSNSAQIPSTFFTIVIPFLYGDMTPRSARGHMCLMCLHRIKVPKSYFERSCLLMHLEEKLAQFESADVQHYFIKAHNMTIFLGQWYLLLWTQIWTSLHQGGMEGVESIRKWYPSMESTSRNVWLIQSPWCSQHVSWFDSYIHLNRRNHPFWRTRGMTNRTTNHSHRFNNPSNISNIAKAFIEKGNYLYRALQISLQYFFYTRVHKWRLVNDLPWSFMVYDTETGWFGVKESKVLHERSTLAISLEGCMHP